MSLSCDMQPEDRPPMDAVQKKLRAAVDFFSLGSHGALLGATSPSSASSSAADQAAQTRAVAS